MVAGQPGPERQEETEMCVKIPEAGDEAEISRVFWFLPLSSLSCDDGRQK